MGFDSLELGVGMQRWGLTALNWVWEYRGGVQEPRTVCGHAEVGLDSLELGANGLPFILSHTKQDCQLAKQVFQACLNLLINWTFSWKNHARRIF